MDEAGRGRRRRPDRRYGGGQRRLGAAVLAKDVADRRADLAAGFAVFPRRNRQEKSEAAEQQGGAGANHGGMVPREIGRSGRWRPGRCHQHAKSQVPGSRDAFERDATNYRVSRALNACTVLPGPVRSGVSACSLLPGSVSRGVSVRSMLPYRFRWGVSVCSLLQGSARHSESLGPPQRHAAGKPGTVARGCHWVRGLQ
jgi:hypothetical protein